MGKIGLLKLAGDNKKMHIYCEEHASFAGDDL
jgi:hypothetical protein